MFYKLSVNYDLAYSDFPLVNKVNNTSQLSLFNKQQSVVTRHHSPGHHQKPLLGWGQGIRCL